MQYLIFCFRLGRIQAHLAFTTLKKKKRLDFRFWTALWDIVTDTVNSLQRSLNSIFHVPLHQYSTYGNHDNFLDGLNCLSGRLKILRELMRETLTCNRVNVTSCIMGPRKCSMLCPNFSACLKLGLKRHRTFCMWQKQHVVRRFGLSTVW